MRFFSSCSELDADGLLHLAFTQLAVYASNEASIPRGEPLQPRLNEIIEQLSLQDGGTVWILNTLELDEPIRMRNHVRVDCLGNRLVATNQFMSFVTFQGCKNATFTNARLIQTELHRAPAIRLTTWPFEAATQDNLVENIRFLYEGPEDYEGFQNPALIGISIDAKRGTSISRNTFENIYMERVTAGIYIRHPRSFIDETAGYIEGNMFSNIVVKNFVDLVEFDWPAYNSVININYNLFSCLRGIATGNVQGGVSLIAGIGNHFDHFVIENWEAGRTYDADDFEFRVSSYPRAEGTYISAHELAGVHDHTDNPESDLDIVIEAPSLCPGFVCDEDPVTPKDAHPGQGAMESLACIKRKRDAFSEFGSFTSSGGI